MPLSLEPCIRLHKLCTSRHHHRAMNAKVKCKKFPVTRFNYLTIGWHVDADVKKVNISCVSFFLQIVNWIVSYDTVSSLMRWILNAPLIYNNCHYIYEDISFGAMCSHESEEKKKWKFCEKKKTVKFFVINLNVHAVAMIAQIERKISEETNIKKRGEMCHWNSWMYMLNETMSSS